MLCIITARGGSKRIPNKNIKEFCGEPIIAYSIKAALKSGIFSEVMVSTDSKQIAKVAKSFGASVPFMRSAKNSDDFATTRDVLLEVLACYKKQNKEFKNFACIYPTAPFVTAQKLQNAAEILLQNNADMVIPIVKFSFPPQRAFILQDDECKWLDENSAKMRSQDLPPLYHDAGQFYFYNTKAFLNSENLRKKAIILNELEVQDIDNLDDWNLAQIKYKILNDLL